MEDEDEVLHNDPLVAMERAMDSYAAVCQRQEVEFDKFERAKFTVGLDCFIKTATECQTALAEVRKSIACRIATPKTRAKKVVCSGKRHKRSQEEHLKDIHKRLNSGKKWTRQELAKEIGCDKMLVTKAVKCLPNVKSGTVMIRGKNHSAIWRDEKCEYSYNPDAYVPDVRKDGYRKFGAHQLIALEMAKKGPVTAKDLSLKASITLSKAGRALLSLRGTMLTSDGKVPPTYTLAQE